MKKIPGLLLIMILAMGMMFTGCGGSESAPETESQQSGQNASAGDGGEAVTDNDGLEGMGDLLSSAFVDMMKDDEYLLKYKATIEFEGESIEVTATVATAGDDTAMTSSGEGLETTMIIKDDKVHMVDHASKSVMSWAQTQETEDQLETGAIDADEMTYLGSGNEDGLIYEEYSTEDGSVKYYFDGKELVKIAVTNEEGIMVMDIIEISNEVPASMFEIPSGYQVIEM